MTNRSTEGNFANTLLGAMLLTKLEVMSKKTKKIRMINYLNKQTAFQIGAMWKACGYKVVYVF